MKDKEKQVDLTGKNDKISQLVENFLSQFKYILKGKYSLTSLDIEKIFKIKSFEIDEDLKKDPRVTRFFFLVNQLETFYFKSYSLSHHDFEVSTRELLSRAFLQLENLFVCILNGYYSKDNYGLFQRISDFFDLLSNYIGRVVEDTIFNKEDSPSSSGIVADDWEDMVELVFEEISVKIRNGRLLIDGSRIGDDFTLNIEKIIENTAFEDEFFQYHLKEFYERPKADAILKKLNED